MDFCFFLGGVVSMDVGLRCAALGTMTTETGFGFQEVYGCSACGGQGLGMSKLGF